MGEVLRQAEFHHTLLYQAYIETDRLKSRKLYKGMEL